MIKLGDWDRHINHIEQCDKILETQVIPIFDPESEVPWRRKCLPTSVFLSGEPHGQRNLMDYSHRVSQVDMAKAISKLYL